MTYTVPRGQRLVIEYISLAATRPLLNATLTTVVHDTSVSYPLPTSATGNAFAQQVRLYVGGGTTVTVAVIGAGFASVTDGLFGYLAPDVS